LKLRLFFKDYAQQVAPWFEIIDNENTGDDCLLTPRALKAPDSNVTSGFEARRSECQKHNESVVA
jgi:hypothetical protein